MNYRQWKKNYKKQHGHNPSASVDRRRLTKIIRKTHRRITKAVQDLNSGFIDIGRKITTAIGALSMFSEQIKEKERKDKEEYENIIHIE